MIKQQQNKSIHKQIPFALPDIGQEEIDNVTQCLESGWLTSGPKVRQFESDFEKFLGNKINAISLSSATSGLFLSLESLGISRGDEVITTPYTFSSTAMSIVHLGASPVFVDIDPKTMNIATDKIESAITDKTRAIIPVHFAGLACDMDEIIRIAKKHNLAIIEDAAHALPSTYKGQLIGSLDTDATVYSFYATKTITTGEGGMIATKNPELAKRMRTMRMHGISKDIFDRYTSTNANWYYEVVAPGYKCNLTDIAAAIGIPQLKKAHKFQQRREHIKNMYKQALKDLPIQLPEEPIAGDIHAWHLFVIRLNDGLDRDDFIQKMGDLYQIGCSVHFIPLNLHKFWQYELSVNDASFPNAVKAYKKSVSLPIYTKMTDEDVNQVINACIDLLGK